MGQKNSWSPFDFAQVNKVTGSQDDKSVELFTKTP